MFAYYFYFVMRICNRTTIIPSQHLFLTINGFSISILLCIVYNKILNWFAMVCYIYLWITAMYIVEHIIPVVNVYDTNLSLISEIRSFSQAFMVLYYCVHGIITFSHERLSRIFNFSVNYMPLSIFEIIALRTAGMT